MIQQLVTERLRQVRDFRIPKELHTFSWIMVSQLFSQIASGTMVFALMIWVFQQEQSFMDFTMILIASMIPALFVSPIAGVLVDRWPRRWVIIGGDAGAILISGAIGYLAWTNQLEIWHLYVAAIMATVFDAFQDNAFDASVALLVPKRHLMRVNGLSETAEAVIEMLSPLLAGVLLVWIGIAGIVVIDIITFVVAVGVMLYIDFPELPRWNRKKRAAAAKRVADASQDNIIESGATVDGSAVPTGAVASVEADLEDDDEEDLPIWESLVFAWNYLHERKGLMIIIYFFMVNAFVLGLVGPLMTPLALTFMSPDVMGVVATISASGLLIGGLIVTFRGDRDGLVRNILAGMLVLGVGIAVLGIWPSVTLYGVAMFIIALSAPFINSAIQAVFQSKVATEVQGRVFSMVGALVGSVNPIALLLGGLLADNVFEPMLMDGGLLANTVGQVIGIGPGRGVGFMCIIIGVVSVIFTLVFSRSPRLRNVETELPDAVNEEDEDEHGFFGSGRDSSIPAPLAGDAI